jgi:hypothetical protein
MRINVYVRISAGREKGKGVSDSGGYMFSSSSIQESGISFKVATRPIADPL